MHRVRTWARAKAHQGRISTDRTQNRAVTTTSPSAATAPTVGDSDPPADGEKNTPEAKGVAVRLLLTTRDIVFSSYINVLLVFVPVGIAAHIAKLPAGIIFAMNAIAIVPLAGMLSHATEIVASQFGDTIGALMNVTFGNAVELIIFIIALVKNELRIVQASLLGSILANLLLILGMCFLFGGLRFREQIYNSTVTQMSASMLSLSVISLLLPTAFHASFKDEVYAEQKVLQVSRGVSVILLLVYGLYLVFQLNSHSYMYESTPQHIIEQETHPGPGAQLFESSSESDTPSASSDSDDQTRQKIKRMIRRTTRRRRSSASTQPGSSTTPAQETAPVVSNESRSSSQKQSPKAIAPKESINDEQPIKEADERIGRQKKRHKSRKRKHSIQAKSYEDGFEHARPGPDSDPHIEFPAASDLEAQSETSRPKPFALRTLRPTISKHLSQNVFSNPSHTTNDTPAHHANSAPRLRRAESMPSGHQNQLRRSLPGVLPPIVPIIVNGTPKSTAVKEAEPEKHAVSRTTAVVLLLVSTGLVALCAEFMVDSISEVVESQSGVSEAFIGLILLPIVGNAAEHVTAVTVALKNKMDLALGVALGSSIQIAIFVTPLVIVLAWMMGKSLSLYFTLFETVSLFVSAFIVNFLVLDGRSNYLEGALLCSAYVIIAVAAYFFPDNRHASSAGGGSDNFTDTQRFGAEIAARGLANLVRS